jgi:hypothetical protein
VKSEEWKKLLGIRHKKKVRREGWKVKRMMSQELWVMNGQVESLQNGRIKGFPSQEGRRGGIKGVKSKE